jgi:hypothetical protein
MAMADVGRTLLSASAGVEPYSRPLKGMASALPQNSLLALVIPKDFNPEESAFAHRANRHHLASGLPSQVNSQSKIENFCYPFAFSTCSACLREVSVSLAPLQRETRAASSPGHKPVQLQNNYRYAEIGSQGYLRSLPVLRLLTSSPTKDRECCGPGGIRTRTL